MNRNFSVNATSDERPPHLCALNIYNQNSSLTNQYLTEDVFFPSMLAVVIFIGAATTAVSARKPKRTLLRRLALPGAAAVYSTTLVALVLAGNRSEQQQQRWCASFKCVESAAIGTFRTCAYFICRYKIDEVHRCYRNANYTSIFRRASVAVLTLSTIESATLCFCWQLMGSLDRLEGFLLVALLFVMVLIVFCHVVTLFRFATSLCDLQIENRLVNASSQVPKCELFALSAFVVTVVVCDTLLTVPSTLDFAVAYLEAATAAYFIVVCLFGLFFAAYSVGLPEVDSRKDEELHASQVVINVGTTDYTRV